MSTEQTNPIKTIDKGTGKPVVVLIHGICCAPADYQWHIDAMSKSHRVIAPTLRGHDHRNSTNNGDANLDELTIEKLSAGVAQLLKEKNITEAILCGHSLGVRIALDTHRQIPERVAGIVFLDGSISVANNLDAVLEGFDNATANGKITPWIQGLFREMFMPGQFTDQQAMYQQRITNMPDADLSSLYRNLIIWDGQEFFPQLKTLNDKPLLVVQSTMRASDASRRSLEPGETGSFPQQIAENHPNTTIVTYAHCSHFLNLDEPQRLLDDISAWITQSDLS